MEKPFKEEIINSISKWMASNICNLKNSDAWLHLYTIRLLSALHKYEETGDIEKFRKELWQN